MARIQGGRVKGDTSTSERKRRDALSLASEVTGIQNLTKTGGISGTNKAVYEMGKKTWEQVEPYAVHVGDAAAMVQEVRAMMNRNLTVTMLAPGTYGEELLAMHRDSARGFTFVRFYVVPRDAFRDVEPDDDDDDPDDDEPEVDDGE